MASFVHLSHLNGFLPKLTGQLVAFMTDPRRDAMNMFVQYVKHDQPLGVYLKFGRDEAIRMPDTTISSWARGSRMRTGVDNAPIFKGVSFQTKREAFPYELDIGMVQQADGWMPNLYHMNIAMSKALTLRRLRVYDIVNNATLPAAMTATATVAGGGKFDVGTVAAPYFFKGLQTAARTINKYTNGVVQPQDIYAIIPAEDALAIASTAEMRDFIKGSVWAKGAMIDTLNPGSALSWGLPPKYAGINLIVDNSMYVDEEFKADGTEATTNRKYINPSDTITLVSRVGGIEGVMGAPSYSTIQCYHNGPLTQTKTEVDTWNELIKGAVVEEYVPVLSSEYSMFRITDTVG